MVAKKFLLDDGDDVVDLKAVVEIPWAQRVQVTLPTTVEMDRVVNGEGVESLVAPAYLLDAIEKYKQGESIRGSSSDPRSYLLPSPLIKIPHGKSVMVLREKWASFSSFRDSVKSWNPKAPEGDDGNLSAAQRFEQTRAVQVIDGRSYVTFDYVDPTPVEDGKRKNVRKVEIPLDSWDDFVSTLDKVDAGFDKALTRLIAKLSPSTPPSSGVDSQSHQD